MLLDMTFQYGETIEVVKHAMTNCSEYNLGFVYSIAGSSGSERVVVVTYRKCIYKRFVAPGIY